MILDLNGRKQKKTKAKKELSDMVAATSRIQRAKYDAAGSSTEYKNYWANSDQLDADSANSRAVREKLVSRSRYEVGNNGYSDGIAQTYATDLIGKGPTLRMQTSSENFNRMVENAWYQWCKAVKFRSKLWCMAHAKHQDGESFAVLRRNKGLGNTVKLDLVLHETEQIQTPLLPYNQPGYIDGIKFDEFGNPTSYDILKYHPGSNHTAQNEFLNPEEIPAKYMVHWFKMRRPGQHRGVPEMGSTLNLGASARRWREAVVAAAENIADFSLFIKTQFQPDEMDSVSPMSTLDIQKRMMTALPAGYDAFQPRAEQPTATHAEFSKSLISEQARPRSMPLNKAACDSSSYNYASGRLDHQTYYGSLDVDREDCDDMVLEPLFATWMEFAIVANGWFGGDASLVDTTVISHTWDWPKHQVADIESEANANDKRLKNGTTSLTATYSDSGMDYEDEITKSATSNGVTLDQQRQINMLLNLPQHVIPVVAQLLGLSQPAQPQQIRQGVPSA
jgi:capsid protein